MPIREGEPPRVVATARYWSRYGGGRYTEALEVIRDGVRPEPHEPEEPPTYRR